MSLDLKPLLADFCQYVQFPVLPLLEKIPAEYRSTLHVEVRLPLTSPEKNMTV